MLDTLNDEYKTKYGFNYTLQGTLDDYHRMWAEYWKQRIAESDESYAEYLRDFEAEEASETTGANVCEDGTKTSSNDGKSLDYTESKGTSGNDDSLSDLDDYSDIELWGEDYSGENLPEPGDYLESETYPISGTVVDVIYNSLNEPICYKVFDPQDGFDYIAASDKGLHEQSGSMKWGLSQVGYELIEEEDRDVDPDGETCFSYFINKETGDIVLW